MFLDFPPLSHGDTHLRSVHVHILETSVPFSVHTKSLCDTQAGNARKSISTPPSVFFLAAGRLVSVPDREPREEEREAEERRRFLAASLLSSAAL